MNTQKLKLGIIGCGNISQAYFDGDKLFDNVEIVACADLRAEAAQAKAEENGVEALTIPELLAREDIDIVINLTIPRVHAAVSIQILEAGKHAYSEKPLAATFAEGVEVLQVAERCGKRIGCAPDTVLGSSMQTVRELVDDGAIGRVTSGIACMLTGGPENWHPAPASFYSPGGGPLFDMGPYYLTALVTFLGPIKSICAVTSQALDERIAGHESCKGDKIPVTTPTHCTGILQFHSGAVITMIVSFDVPAHKHHPMELYGLEGTLRVPDPNEFGNPVELFNADSDWADVPLERPYSENSRMIGVADLAQGITADEPHRCNGAVALHVLEAMEAFDQSSKAGTTIYLKSTCERPAALPRKCNARDHCTFEPKNGS